MLAFVIHFPTCTVLPTARHEGRGRALVTAEALLALGTATLLLLVVTEALALAGRGLGPLAVEFASDDVVAAPSAPAVPGRATSWSRRAACSWESCL